MSKITTILFDFDGTLVNTNDVIIASWQHTYRYYTGKEESLEKITACFGEPLLLTMAREFPAIDPEESAGVYRTFQQENADELVTIFPGILNMLRDLKNAGYRLAIVTSRTRESAQRYMDMFGIASYFDDMVSCEDTNVHKPNPEPILLCMQKLGVSREDCIMIGDSPFDIKCANNAGVLSVLVAWRITGSGAPEVADAKWDYEIAEPADLLTLLVRINCAEQPHAAMAAL